MERLTPDEINQMAMDVVMGRAFIPVNDEEMRIGFSLLLSAVDEAELEQCGNVIGYMTDTFPRSVNGLPMFTKCRLIHEDDLPVLNEAIHRKIDALQT